MTASTARIVSEYLDEETARLVAGALGPDDDRQATTRQDGPRIVFELEGPTPPSLLRAVDDLLACLAVAEDVIKTR